MKIERDGVELNVRLDGEGAPVLLLHGFPDSHELWRNQIPALNAAGFQTIAPDLRGFGDSDKPENVDAYGLMEHLADLAAIMDHAGVARAHVVGHDWGAVIAWMLATFMPERVDRLATLSIGRVGTRARTLESLSPLWYMFLFQFDEVEEFLTRDDWAQLRAWGSLSPDIDRSIERLAKPGALRAALAIYRANATPAVLLAPPLDLPKIKAPTMGIWGARDFVPEEQMTASANDVAGTWRYERIEDAGHWTPLEAPERLNELLLSFLR